MSLATQQSETDAVMTQSAAAKLLHPEDISVGDEVTPAVRSYDYPSFFWCMADPAIMPPNETIRLNVVPHETSKPFKVVAVCLPFVLCEKVDGKFTTFDVRKVQLMRLTPEFAELARMGYATKKRKKLLEAEKVQQQAAAASEPIVDSFNLGESVAFVCPLPVDAEPVSVNALTEDCVASVADGVALLADGVALLADGVALLADGVASAQVVLFEFAVQIPLADPENVGRFFSVVVSQS